MSHTDHIALGPIQVIRPDFTEAVAGVDEPAAEDLAQMGVPTDDVSDIATDSTGTFMHKLGQLEGREEARIATVRARVHWKARALKSERDVSDLRGALLRARILGWLVFALAIVALGVAVGK